MAGDGWDAVRVDLARALAALEDGEFLVVGEPVAAPGPPRGLLRRRAAPPPTRYVQFRRDQDTVYAECVGATSFGGDWDVDPATRDRLRGLGWLEPDEGDGPGPAFPNYWCRRPLSEADAVAGLGSDSLHLLGADPSGLEWRRDG